MPIVELPNGIELEFDEETSPEVMRNAIYRKFPEYSKQNKDNVNLETFKKATGFARTPVDTLRDALAGIVGGLGKGGQTAAGLMTGGYAPKVDFNEIESQIGSPKQTTGGEFVKGISEYAPYGVAGGARLLPEVAKFSSRLGAIPYLTSLGQVGAGATYGAATAPEGEKGKGAFISALVNALTHGAASPVANPIIRSTIRGGSRAALGAGAGYQIGGTPKSAAEGALIGIAAPHLIRATGLTGHHPALDLLSQVELPEVEKRIQAAKELGDDTLTISEAANRPDVTAQEKSIGRLGAPAREKVKIGEERNQLHNKIINNFLDKLDDTDIDPSLAIKKAAQKHLDNLDKTRIKESDPYYDIAHTKKVDPNLVKKLESEYPILSESIDRVLADKKYQMEGELLGHDRNSIKTLDYAKRDIDRQIQKAITNEDDDAVRVLTKTKNDILDRISGFSPDYKKAREVYSLHSKPYDEADNSVIGQLARTKDTNLKSISNKVFDPANMNMDEFVKMRDAIRAVDPKAWDAITKNEIGRLMERGKSKEYNGRNFVDNVLSNNVKYAKLQKALEHNPSALKDLQNMKTAWQNVYSPMSKVGTVAGRSDVGTNEKRTIPREVIDYLKNKLTPKSQIKALNFLYSPEWKEALIKQTQDKINPPNTLGDKLKKLSPTLIETILRGFNGN